MRAVNRADEDRGHTAPLDPDELQRYEAALRSYIRRRAPTADVDDLVQEALLRLVATRRQVDVITPLAYLFRIASNLIVDHARAQRRALAEQTLGVWGSVTVAADQEYRTHYDQLRAAYHLALGDLTPRCREVFVLRRHRNLTTPQIAEQLGISHRMVQKYMVQALALLTERLRAFVAGEQL